VSKDIWTWLRSCRTCDKPHDKRNIGGSMVSWADRVDEHPYLPRLHRETVDVLQAEWRRDRDAEKVEG
jgi:hypothetical protein